MPDLSIFRLKIFRRLAFSYLFLVSLSIAGISLLLYVQYAARSTEEVGTQSRAMLRQTASVASMIFNQVQNTADQLISTPEVVTTLYAKAIDREAEYKAVQKFQVLQSTYPYINSFSVYNGITDRYLNTRWIPASIDAAVIDRIRSAGGQSYIDVMPRTVKPLQNEFPEANLITFIVYPYYKMNWTKSKAALVINVSETYLSQVLRTMSVAPNEQLFLVDDHGRVLAHNRPGHFLQDMSRQSWFGPSPIVGQTEWTIHSAVDEVDCLVTFAQEPSLGWTFVSVRPMASLLPYLDQIKAVTFFTALALLLLGSVVALFAARFIYGPMETLLTKVFKVFPQGGVDEVSLFESALTQSRSQCVKFLLHDTVPDDPYEALVLSSFEKELISTWYALAVVKIDDHLAYELATGANQREKHRLAIRQTLSTLFRGTLWTETLVTEENEIVLIAGSDTPDLVPALLAGLKQTQATLRSEYGLSLSAGVGTPVGEIRAIPESYRFARQAVAKKFLVGKGSITTAEDSDPSPSTEGYPAAVEARLIEAVNLRRDADIGRQVAEFRSRLQSVAFDRARAFAAELVFSLIRHFEARIGRVPTDAPAIERLETLGEIEAALTAFAKEIVRLLESRDSHRVDEVVTRMRGFVDTHYTDPNLNLELAAEEVGLSREYAGRLFRQQTGVSFAGELNRVRLEKARELLASTQLSIPVIAEKIGLSNGTYLFTLFKKTYTLTPSQYRETQRLQKKEAV